MQGDFNQSGVQYESQAIAGDSGHYQMLSEVGCRFFQDLQRHLCAKWEGEPKSPELKRWSATMECLQSFLYQSKRLKQHSKELCSLAPPPEQLLGHSGIEALTDFETLLYLGRSALDRLTFAIAKQTYCQDCEKFYKLARILGNYERKDKRAEHAIKVIELALPDFQGVLIDGKDGKTGLRSLLAHSRSTGECLTHVFAVHRSTDGKILRFDLELERNGVLNTSWALNKTVPFVVLNLVALYSDFGRTITLKDCHPNWAPQCICLSSFIDTTEQGPRFTTLRANACGFEVITRHVRHELFAHAQKI